MKVEKICEFCNRKALKYTGKICTFADVKAFQHSCVCGSIVYLDRIWPIETETSPKSEKSLEDGLKL